MKRSRQKSSIPDRWLKYKAVGKRIRGTRFIAFKVPLKQALNSQLSYSEVFGHWELLDELKKQQQELGLIIDLTFTTRYYNLHDLPQSLTFTKIFTAGHEIPSDETILSFKRAVRRFLRDNDDNDKLIGVHCTHGLNRTGYLICRYLIDVDGMEPKEAVRLFNVARGHNIERQNYLKDLHCGPKRSNEGMEECEEEPARGLAKHPEPKSSHLSSRGTRHSGQNHHPQNSLHRSPLLPTPVFSHTIRAPLDPYGYRPHHPDSQRQRPPQPEYSRSTYPRSLPPQHDRGRRRGPHPPPPPLPQYTPNHRRNY